MLSRAAAELGQITLPWVADLLRDLRAAGFSVCCWKGGFGSSDLLTALQAGNP